MRPPADPSVKSHRRLVPIEHRPVDPGATEPTRLPPNCDIGAILEREDPNDCLVVKKGLSYTKLEDFPDGSVVGTSSVRRVAQLRRQFPKLAFADVVGS